MNRYINPANAVTASRFLALPPFAYWIDSGAYQLAALMVIINGVLDLFDGAVARLFKCTSGFGELLDAITDAISIGFFLVVLALVGRAPMVPVIGVLVLGTVNAGFRFVYARRAGRATNYRSYAMERMVAFTVYLVGFCVFGFEEVFFAWVTFIVTGVILLHDAKRMLLDPIPPAPAS
ncbi:MAG TPA: CDP-alcohol phosphatidyltransferase family protein [Kofleriaceae bacterium]|nr:CDP-alcohol phosphatidyltransferase family protein [Kofleriaceae bacterium]